MTSKAQLILGARPRPLPAWRLMLNVADKHTARLRRLVEAVLVEGQDAISLGALEAAIARGDRSMAERIALAAFPTDALDTLQDVASCGCGWDAGLRRYCAAHNPCFGTLAPQPVFKVASAPEPLVERLLDVMEDSGNATRCSVRQQATATSEATAESLRAYQNNGYQRINEALRAGGEIANEQTRELIQAIDAGFANAPSRRLTVYRADGAALSSVLFERLGIKNIYMTIRNVNSATTRAALSEINQKIAGQMFTDLGFVSTAKTEKAAMKFVAGSSEIQDFGGQGLVVITGRAKALDVDALTGLRTNEKELLLPRGTSFKIKRVEIEEHPDGSRVFFRWFVEIIGG